MNLAAGYSESPSPSQSAKGSFTNLGAESARGSRGNKENEGGSRQSSKAGSEGKYLEKQNQVLLGEAAAYVRCPTPSSPEPFFPHPLLPPPPSPLPTYGVQQAWLFNYKLAYLQHW